MYTMYIVSQYFYEVVSDHFTEEETRAPTVEVNLPKVSELVSGGARFQALWFQNWTEILDFSPTAALVYADSAQSAQASSGSHPYWANPPCWDPEPRSDKCQLWESIHEQIFTEQKLYSNTKQVKINKQKDKHAAKEGRRSQEVWK